MRLIARFVALWIAAGIASPAAVFASDVGMVAPFVSTYCPTGWLPLDGRHLSNGPIYSELFSIINSSPAWGTGSQSGIYYVNLPNAGGSFIRGWTHSQSVDSGRVFGSSQQDSFQGHWHQYAPFPYGTQYTGTVNFYTDSLLTSPDYNWVRNDRVQNPISDGVNGTPRYGSETRPVNIALLYCVKARADSVGGSVGISTFTLVDVSTTAAAQLNPGIWGYFTAGDVSFWFGVLLALVAIWGFKAGGMR